MISDTDLSCRKAIFGHGDEGETKSLAKVVTLVSPFPYVIQVPLFKKNRLLDILSGTARRGRRSGSIPAEVAALIESQGRSEQHRRPTSSFLLARMVSQVLGARVLPPLPGFRILRE